MKNTKDKKTKKDKSYLRIIYPVINGESRDIDIFEGDIKKDKRYWDDYHHFVIDGKIAKHEIKYFELKEAKI